MSEPKEAPHPPLPPPDGLKDAGLFLWAGIAGSGMWKLRADELRVLEDACREADLIDRFERELDDSPLMVVGSQGQLVASPLVSEIRQHRTVFAGLMSKLKLPETDHHAEAKKAQATNQARKAARARWDRPKLTAVSE